MVFVYGKIAIMLYKRITGCTSTMEGIPLDAYLKLGGEWLANPNLSFMQIVAVRYKLTETQLNIVATNPIINLADLFNLMPTRQMVVSFFMFNPNATFASAKHFKCEGHFANNPNYSLGLYLRYGYREINTAHNPWLNWAFFQHHLSERFMSPILGLSDLNTLLCIAPQLLLRNCEVNTYVDYTKLQAYDNAARQRGAIGAGIVINPRTMSHDNPMFLTHNPNSPVATIWNHNTLHKYKVMALLEKDILLMFGYGLFNPYLVDCCIICKK